MKNTFDDGMEGFQIVRPDEPVDDDDSNEFGDIEDDGHTDDINSDLHGGADVVDLFDDEPEISLSEVQLFVAEQFADARAMGRMLRTEGTNYTPRHKDRDFAIGAPLDDETDEASF